MPQIKLDFLYLVQTYVLAEKYGGAKAANVAYNALHVTAECLEGGYLDNKAVEFCCGQATEWPSWCVFES